MSIDHRLTLNAPLKLVREFIHLLQEIFPPLILQDQDCFAGEAGAEELLALLPADARVESLREKWLASPDKSSEEKWDEVRNLVKRHGKATTPGVSSPTDTKEYDSDPIYFHRNFSWPRWKISSSNTLGPESMQKSRSIEITYSRLRSVSTRRLGGSACL